MFTGLQCNSVNHMDILWVLYWQPLSSLTHSQAVKGEGNREENRQTFSLGSIALGNEYSCLSVCVCVCVHM